MRRSKIVAWLAFLAGAFVLTFLFQVDILMEAPVDEPEIVIIGGGVTGLCAARRLEEYGYVNYVVLEGSEHVGGLARSFTDEQGFTWDLGVHVLFSHFEFFDLLLDEALPPRSWFYHQRKSPAFMRDRFVGYPVQDNLANFPRDEALRIIDDLQKTRDDRAQCKSQTGKVNFAQWMHNCFGDELTKSFGKPYNFKVWGYPAEEMNSRWVGQRVATIDVKDVVSRFESGEESTAWGPNSFFRYPIEGTGSIWEGVGKLIPSHRIRTQVKVQGIDTESKHLSLNSGYSMPYDYVISTMPMDKLASMMKLPAQLKEKTDSGFKKQSCHLIGFGLECAMPKELVGVSWIYFPEDKYPFYRITVLSNLSPQSAPNPATQWSILTETSETPVKPLNDTNLNVEVLSALRSAGLIPSQCQVKSTWKHNLEYGYPVPYMGRDADVHAMDAFLLKNQIYSRGRFGAWKYEVANQDHSCAQGVQAVDNILLKRPETAFRTPSDFNAQYNNHEKLPPAKHFSTNNSPLNRLQRWTLVVARCRENVLPTLEHILSTAVPESTRFRVLIYEYCQEPINYSLHENMLHVARVPTPEHIDSVELAFAYHTSLVTDRVVSRELNDMTVFVPAKAIALVDGKASLSPWLRCPDLFAALRTRQANFGVLAIDRKLITSKPSETACDNLQDMLATAICPAQISSCIGPDDIFFVSAQRLANHKLPQLPRSRTQIAQASKYTGGYSYNDDDYFYYDHDSDYDADDYAYAYEFEDSDLYSSSGKKRSGGVAGEIVAAGESALTASSVRVKAGAKRSARSSDYGGADEQDVDLYDYYDDDDSSYYYGASDDEAWAPRNDLRDGRDWRQLWPIIFGEPAELQPRHCISAFFDADGNVTRSETPRNVTTLAAECPVRSHIKGVLAQGAPPPRDRRRTVLVTGGLGNIGLSLVRQLLTDPYSVPSEYHSSDKSQKKLVSHWRVVVVDTAPAGKRLTPELKALVDKKRLVVHKLDVTDYDGLLALMQSETGQDVRGVIHLAAVSRVHDCNTDAERCLAVNNHGTERIARAMQTAYSNHLLAPWLLFTSSREVFGNTADTVVHEDSTLVPHNIYGSSKALAEAHVKQLTDHGYRALTLRLTNVYGSWEDLLERVVPSFVCHAKANAPLPVMGGKQNLNLLYINDTVRGIEMAMAHVASRKPGNYFEAVHLAADVENIAISQLAQKVIKLVDSKSKIQLLSAEASSVDDYNTRTDKARLMLGWKAKVALDDGLKQFIADYPYGKARCPTLRGAKNNSNNKNANAGNNQANADKDEVVIHLNV